MQGKDLPKPIRTPLVLHWIGVLVARLTGWRAAGELPDLKKFVVIVAPHTSNWDLPVCVMFSFVLRLRGYWFGKHTIFWPPLGWILRAYGGIAIDRRSHHSFVYRAASLFKERDVLVLAIAPEGTRAYTEYWKSGFYHIAVEAGVPIALAFLDFKHKRCGIGAVVYPTGNIKEDMDKIRDFYSRVEPRHPALRSAVRLREEDPPPGNQQA